MLMNVADYAARRGCAPAAVLTAIAAGRISITEDNRIDTDIADAAWDENTFSSLQRKPPATAGSPSEPPKTRSTEPVPGITFTDARALREVFDAQRKQLELQVRRGELVERDAVEREAYGLYRQLRDAVMNVPHRLAAQLASETDEHVVHEALEGELKRVLTDFAEGRTT